MTSYSYRHLCRGDRSHVSQGAHEFSGSRQITGIVRLSEAEIGNPDPPLFVHNQIRGFDVPVQNSLGVRVGEGLRHLLSGPGRRRTVRESKHDAHEARDLAADRAIIPETGGHRTTRDLFESLMSALLLDAMGCRRTSSVEIEAEHRWRNS